jgi:hypothetical protein
MKRDLGQFSLVIVGRWNAAILSPAWLAKEVFGEAEMGIMFPVLGWGPPVFRVADINIAVTDSTLTFAPRKDTDDVLTRIENAGRHILRTLPHTPIMAFGENYHYIVGDPPPEITNVLNNEDTSRLAQQGAIAETVLIRSMRLPACQLNLKIAFGQPCHIDLNYHYAPTAPLGAAEAMEKAMENTFVKNRDHGIELLKTVYKLTLDEDIIHDNKSE